MSSNFGYGKKLELESCVWKKIAKLNVKLCMIFFFIWPRRTHNACHRAQTPDVGINGRCSTSGATKPRREIVYDGIWWIVNEIICRCKRDKNKLSQSNPSSKYSKHIISMIPKVHTPYKTTVTQDDLRSPLSNTYRNYLLISYWDAKLFTLIKHTTDT